MNYILKPSLEHITLIKIAAMVWNLPDIRALMVKFCIPLHFCIDRKKWQEVEKRAIQKVHKLPQPKHLQEKVLGLIKPIGLQILMWIQYHYENFDGVNLNFPNEFCWTSQGTVNKKKTAAILIKDEHIDIIQRYILACIYCLENDITKLWKKLSENQRNFFYSEADMTHVVQQKLVTLWTDKTNGGTVRFFHESSHQYAFELSANNGNKTAVEYFITKLTTGEKEESMVKTAEYVAKKHDYCQDSNNYLCENYAEVLCFLLSHMNEEQQIDIFKSHAYYVLISLLDWPWQGFFLETANRMWNFLSVKSYNQSLKVIISKIMKGYKDFDYQKIFQEFWRQSPDAFKRHVTDDNRSIANILYRLLQIKDEKNIKMIIQSASLVARKNLIFSKRGRCICDEMIYCEEWDLLKFYIEESILSKNELEQFKAEFKEHLALRCSRNELPKNKERWDKFFHFLDNFVYRE